MTDLSFSSSRDATAAGAIKRPEREMTETIMSSQAVNHNDERNSVCVCVCVCVCADVRPWQGARSGATGGHNTLITLALDVMASEVALGAAATAA